MSSIGKNLHDIRERHGIGQEELAEVMGIAKSTLSRIERGERTVSAQALAIAAAYLGEDINSFFGKIPPRKKPLSPLEIREELSRCTDLAPETREVFVKALLLATEENKRSGK